MKIKPSIISFTAIALSLSVLQGCSSYMYGYTSEKSLNRYLLVDQGLNNFGYKRLQYDKGYFELDSFLKEHGNPDFFIEKREKGEQLKITFFYVKKDEAITLEEKGVRSTLSYIDTRPLSDYEKATYNQLSRKQ